MIYIFYGILLLSFLINTSYAQYSNLFIRWDKTDKLIREKKIEKDAAIDSIRKYVKFADTISELSQRTKQRDWKYPIAGFTEISYRKNGNDYKDDSFDYFQGGEYKGHPAHDIFILDKDSNGIEDVTGKKVEAAAMVNGVIISIQTGWKPGDLLRSGNYIKLYEPESQAIFYYSHLDSVFATVGQFVKAGDIIGLVGRTGRKAIRGRTHLHIAYYKIEEGYPVPEDIFKQILESR